ncbi:MAG: Dienelactone hydrolase [Verrucomicrobiales bacterium]|nr:Dienelactone hydrolase [Verrucomicrobiales bacterium]
MRISSRRRILAFVTPLLFSLVTTLSMAETNYTTQWLAKAELAPDFVTPKTIAAWESKRSEIRSTLWQLLGKLPPRPKGPKVETLVREDRGDYISEKFQFDNGAGATVSGYLLLPKTAAKKSPAILYCHWHGGQYEVGKEELFQANHTPEAPGPTLAKRGYVVIGIDAYCFGERNDKGPAGLFPTTNAVTGIGPARELSASKFNLWVGRTLWGMMLRDDLMALDYLVSRPEVDANNIGVTGMSLGATRAWWLMALDDRIKTGVPVACMTRYQNLLQHDSLPAHGIYYFVPGMLNHFDTEAVIACIAPRPVMFMTGDADRGSPIDGIREIETRVKPVYALYGKEKAFENDIYPGLGHKYLPEMWTKMLGWMDQHLKTHP